MNGTSTALIITIHSVAFALAKLGVETIRKTIGSALFAGESILVALGDTPYLAKRQVRLFREHQAA